MTEKVIYPPQIKKVNSPSVNRANQGPKKNEPGISRNKYDKKNSTFTFLKYRRYNPDGSVEMELSVGETNSESKSAEFRDTSIDAVKEMEATHRSWGESISKSFSETVKTLFGSKNRD